jgi:hypothetical protein
LLMLDGDLRHVCADRGLGHYFERTRAMITEHWRAVEALAAELIVHRRIEGERIAEIIDHAMRTADGWRGAS